MLPIEHRAYHLYREDAYREYCMSVDIYQAYQPASFIYLSFEAFKDACIEQGLSLVGLPTQNGQENFPWRHQRETISESTKLRGLILRIRSLEDATVAKDALRLGRNVIVLIPSAILALHWHSDFNEASQKGCVKFLSRGLCGILGVLLPEGIPSIALE